MKLSQELKGTVITFAWCLEDCFYHFYLYAFFVNFCLSNSWNLCSLVGFFSSASAFFKLFLHKISVITNPPASCDIINNCDPNGDCVFEKGPRGEGYHRCRCRPGYTGDGIQCTMTSLETFPLMPRICFAKNFMPFSKKKPLWILYYTEVFLDYCLHKSISFWAHQSNFLFTIRNLLSW